MRTSNSFNFLQPDNALIVLGLPYPHVDEGLYHSNLPIMPPRFQENAET
jgi:hypothetical protein